MTQITELNSFSVSKAGLILEIRSKFSITIHLKRHLAPRTVGTLLRSLPVEGNAHFLGKMVYFPTHIDSGLERPRDNFDKGDIAFSPADGTVCIFVDSVHTRRKMSPIGTVTGDTNKLIEIKSGDVLVIYQDAG